MKTIRIFFLIVISLISFSCFAQEVEIKKFVNEGIVFHDKGEYKKAISIYEKALELDPKSNLVNYEISYSYFGMKNYKKAKKYSKKVIDSKTGDLLPAYMVYANSLDILGKHRKAIRSYEKAMKKYDNYLLYYNHAMACLNIDKIDKAFDSAIKAIKNNPSHASSHLILSRVMDKKGSRVEAMLPLYFFLLIEPSTSRGELVYKTLIEYLDDGISRTSSNNIGITAQVGGDSSLGAAEMMIKLLRASNLMKENKGKTELELFAENNVKLFKMLGELKKSNTGFFWEFYVPFFYELANKELVKSFSYYISLSKGEEASKWIKENSNEFDIFLKLIGD